MIIDCNACEMQATTACDECIVPVLLHQMSGPFEIGQDEEQALNNLADAGMVAPLRLVRPDDRDADHCQVPLEESIGWPDGTRIADQGAG
jgi:hypothetical protein